MKGASTWLRMQSQRLAQDRRQPGVGEREACRQTRHVDDAVVHGPTLGFPGNRVTQLLEPALRPGCVDDARQIADTAFCIVDQHFGCGSKQGHGQ